MFRAVSQPLFELCQMFTQVALPVWNLGMDGACLSLGDRDDALSINPVGCDTADDPQVDMNVWNDVVIPGTSEWFNPLLDALDECTSQKIGWCKAIQVTGGDWLANLCAETVDDIVYQWMVQAQLGASSLSHSVSVYEQLPPTDCDLWGCDVINGLPIVPELNDSVQAVGETETVSLSGLSILSSDQSDGRDVYLQCAMDVTLNDTRESCDGNSQVDAVSDGELDMLVVCGIEAEIESLNSMSAESVTSMVVDEGTESTIVEVSNGPVVRPGIDRVFECSHVCCACPVSKHDMERGLTVCQNCNQVSPNGLCDCNHCMGGCSFNDPENVDAVSAGLSMDARLSRGGCAAECRGLDVLDVNTVPVHPVSGRDGLDWLCGSYCFSYLVALPLWLHYNMDRS
jgi:hypothetical protein